MSDTIYRDEAKKAVMWGNRLDGSVVDGICERIDAIPSADRPQGAWIDEAISIIDDMQREGIVDYQQAWEYRMRARMKGADDEATD